MTAAEIVFPSVAADQTRPLRPLRGYFGQALKWPLPDKGMAMSCICCYLCGLDEEGNDVCTYEPPDYPGPDWTGCGFTSQGNCFDCECPCA